MVVPVMLALQDGILTNETMVLLALALIAVLFLMSSTRRRLRGRGQEPVRDTPQREPPRASSRQQLRHDVDEALVELNELARRINADIDVRFAKLEAAIRDADRRIAVLNRLSHKLAGQAGECTNVASIPPTIHAPQQVERAHLGAASLEAAKHVKDLDRSGHEKCVS